MRNPSSLLFLVSLHIIGASSIHATGCRTDCAGRSNVIVSVDGRGDCDSIQAAVNCAPDSSLMQRFDVLVLPGVYREQVLVNKNRLSIVGQSGTNDEVVLTWSVPGEAVLNVTASDFILANLTVFNDANHYVVGKNFALYVSGGDRTAVFYSNFFGAQDTIYTGWQRTFFFGSVINGSSDFLYGQGSAVWDECTIIGEPGSKGWSFITAHSGNNTLGENRSAYLIRNSRLPAPVGARMGATWLGRPWGVQAAVIYENVWMDAHINAGGWNPWYTKCAASALTCAQVYYAEFNSTGPGANPSARVHWSHQLSEGEAANWTVERVLHGWAPPSPSMFWTISPDPKYV